MITVSRWRMQLLLKFMLLCMPVILAFKRRLRQEDCEFEARLVYMARSCLKKIKIKKSSNKNLMSLTIESPGRKCRSILKENVNRGERAHPGLPAGR
jgi:hypothetical protein